MNINNECYITYCVRCVMSEKNIEITVVTLFKQSYLLVMQNRPSFFLNFPYTWSQSQFLFLGKTVQYFSLIAMEIDEDQTLQ